MSKHHHLTRRDFLKLAGAGIGGAILACGKGSELTAVPGSGVTQAGMTPLPPGTTADTILVNGKIFDLLSSGSCLFN